jgi:DNA-binding XRE family transcriptional regulator
MPGPQTAASRKLCSEKTFEFYRETVAAHPERYTPLKRARYAARLRQADVAAAVGIHKGTLCAFEQGREPRTQKTKIALANVLGVTVGSLFDD